MDTPRFHKGQLVRKSHYGRGVILIVSGDPERREDGWHYPVRAIDGGNFGVVPETELTEHRNRRRRVA